MDVCMTCDLSVFVTALRLVYVNKDVSLIMRGRLYSSCVRSSILHGSETWPVRKENDVALQQAEMKIGVALSKKTDFQVRSWEREIRYRWHNIGITAEQAAMIWACVAKRRWCLGEEMYGVWSRELQTKRKTKEDLERGCEKDYQARKLNKEDAIDHSRWRKLIKDVWWSGWVWVGEHFFWYRPTRVVPDKWMLNGCVCMCVSDTQTCKCTLQCLHYTKVFFLNFMDSELIAVISFLISTMCVRRVFLWCTFSDTCG